MYRIWQLCFFVSLVLSLLLLWAWSGLWPVYAEDSPAILFTAHVLLGEYGIWIGAVPAVACFVLYLHMDNRPEVRHGVFVASAVLAPLTLVYLVAMAWWLCIGIGEQDFALPYMLGCIMLAGWVGNCVWTHLFVTPGKVHVC